jgi:hypothetical protein
MNKLVCNSGEQQNDDFEWSGCLSSELKDKIRTSQRESNPSDSRNENLRTTTPLIKISTNFAVDDS